MKDAVNEYLLSFIDPKDKLILEMEEYATENHVPIMDRLGMEFMLQFLRLIGPKSILELGTHAHQLKNENKMNFRSNKLKNT
ncbi:hypothetical protein bcgnr5372_11840 [Bacillus luti]